MFPCSLKQGSCSVVPYDIFPLFPYSLKPLGDPHCSGNKCFSFLKRVIKQKKNPPLNHIEVKTENETFTIVCS